VTTKLSIHVFDPSHPRFLEWLGRARFPYIKFMGYDSEMVIDAVRALGAQVIFRPAYPGGDDSPACLSPERAADYVLDHTRKLLGRGLLWEGLNEPALTTGDEAKRLNQWYVEFAERMHRGGERVLFGSFSTGNPTPDHLELLKLCAPALDLCDGFALHEYLPNAGYYRRIREALPLAKDFYITECGWDIAGRPGDGWQNTHPPETYLQLLQRYDAVLARDPYVKTATIYQLGDTSTWRSFEITPVMPDLVRYAESQGGLGMPEPIVEFTASPARVSPGEAVKLQYAIEFVQAAYLDGQGVAGPRGEKVIRPMTTETHTLRVVYRDQSVKNFDVVVEVSSPSDGASGGVDPRATWVKCQDGARYRVDHVYYYADTPVIQGRDVPQDMTESQVDHAATRVWVKVIDNAGHPLPFETVIHSWPVNEGAAWKTDLNGIAWFDLYGGSSFDPARESGPDEVLVGDAVVSGLGLPLKRHVSYGVVIRRL
jgi:hypothetical protein